MAIVNLYRTGLGPTLIGAKLGCSRVWVWKVLKDQGEPIRAPQRGAARKPSADPDRQEVVEAVRRYCSRKSAGDAAALCCILTKEYTEIAFPATRRKRLQTEADALFKQVAA